MWGHSPFQVGRKKIIGYIGLNSGLYDILFHHKCKIIGFEASFMQC